MATLYGDNYTNALQTTPPVAIDSSQWKGKVRLMFDTIETGVTAANDIIYMARLPSRAVILPQSTCYFDDLDVSSMDFGDSNDPNGLMSAVDMATAAGSASILEAHGIANYGKPLWELLAYTADPGGELDLYFTVNDVGVDGTLSVVILYTID